MSRTRRTEGNVIYSTDSPSQPKSPPVDDSELFTLHSAKYNIVFKGPTLEDCERQLRDLDDKRGGKRIRTKGTPFVHRDKG